MATTELPIKPILDLIDPTRTATRRENAERLGISRKALAHYESTGVVDWVQADRLAIRIGRHPVMIWAGAWCDAVDDPELEQLRLI